MPTRPHVLLLLVVSIGLAGCLAEHVGLGSTPGIGAVGEEPLFVVGWAQDGTHLRQASGDGGLAVVPGNGTGSFGGEVRVDGASYAFGFEGFHGAPDQPSREDGIRAEFPEHGDTGNGHPEIPRLHAVAAGWGKVQMVVDGETIRDPLTGNRTLAGHFMLTDTGIRDDDTRRILTEDGDVYGPSEAGSGRSVEGDRELHVVAGSQAQAPHEPLENASEGELTPTEPHAVVPVRVAAPNAAMTVNVSVDAAAGPGSTVPARVNATLHAPAGNVPRQAQLGGTNQTRNVSWTLDPVTRPGNYQVRLEGDGSARWNVTTTLDYREPLYHWVYEDVEIYR